MRYFYLLLCIVIINACSKNKSDTQKPSIAILTPVQNQPFKRNDTIVIRGVVSDNVMVNKVEAKVISNSTGSSSTVFDNITTIINKPTSDYGISLLVDSSNPVEWRILVTVTDASGNTNGDGVTVQINK
jgi:hypothetical protein